MVEQRRQMQSTIAALTRQLEEFEDGGDLADMGGRDHGSPGMGRYSQGAGSPGCKAFGPFRPWVTLDLAGWRDLYGHGKRLMRRWVKALDRREAGWAKRHRREVVESRGSKSEGAMSDDCRLADRVSRARCRVPCSTDGGDARRYRGGRGGNDGGEGQGGGQEGKRAA